MRWTVGGGNVRGCASSYVASMTYPTGEADHVHYEDEGTVRQSIRESGDVLVLNVINGDTVYVHP